MAMSGHCSLCHVRDLLTIASINYRLLLMPHIAVKIEQSQMLTYPLFSYALFAYRDDLIRDVQVVLASEKAIRKIKYKKAFLNLYSIIIRVRVARFILER